MRHLDELGELERIEAVFRQRGVPFLVQGSGFGVEGVAFKVWG